MTPTPTHIDIALSDRRPVKIALADWPTIAKASWHSDAAHHSQANYIRVIRVREHADGRRIVHGWHDEGPGGAPAGFRDTRAGYLIAPGPNRDAETIRAIRRVAGAIGDDALGDAVIAALPAEVLS
jgi:hypothetical protein